MAELGVTEQPQEVTLEVDETSPIDRDEKPPSYDAAQSGPPPDYGSIFGRIKQAKEDSSGIKDFSASTCDIILGSTSLVLGCLICSGLVMAVPIAMIVIGSMKLDDCPAQRYIPIYLIVCGVMSIVSYILSAGTARQKSNKLQTPDAEGQGGDGETSCIGRWVGCLSCLIGPFLFAWFIAGNVWIYGTYEPTYGDVTAADYCDKTLYLFSFWLLNVTYILMGLSCCFAICGCCGVAAAGKK